ncbi:MAG: substrate-binding domain-containing protein [Burkholderiales bacterium]
MKKTLAILMVLLAMVFVFVGCANTATTPEPSKEASTEPSQAAEPSEAASTEPSKTLKIGATFYSLQNEFTMRMDNAGKKWAEENGVEYVSYDGNYDAATQLSQVETMIADGCDAIILNPQDAVACAAAVEKAAAANIPVIGVNTMVESDLLTSYVGSQDVSAGEDIMRYMIDYLGKDEFNIVIIEGPMGQSAQLQRIEGITNVLKEYPKIKELARDTANWSRSEAMTLMETWLTAYGDDIDAIIAENDEMALGAREAVEAAGKDIPAIGIDGITDAVAAIQKGSMIASDFQNAEGQMTGALDTAVKVINGEKVEKFYWIPFEMITPDNAADYVNKY